MDDEQFRTELRRLEQRAATVAGSLFGHADERSRVRNARAGVRENGVDARALQGPLLVRSTIQLVHRAATIVVADDVASHVTLSQRHLVQSVSARLKVAPASGDVVIRVKVAGVELTNAASRPMVRPESFEGRALRANLALTEIAAGAWITLDVVTADAAASGLVVLLHTLVDVNRGHAEF